MMDFGQLSLSFPIGPVLIISVPKPIKYNSTSKGIDKRWTTPLIFISCQVGLHVISYNMSEILPRISAHLRRAKERCFNEIREMNRQLQSCLSYNMSEILPRISAFLRRVIEPCFNGVREMYRQLQSCLSTAEARQGKFLLCF